jgi:hypothetical protein
MVYDSTKILLRTIIQSLETTDEVAWEDQIELAQECVFEMHQMNRALPLVLGTEGIKKRLAVGNPQCEKLDRAMPHIKSMMTAIRRRNQVAALESGRLALAEM